MISSVLTSTSFELEVLRLIAEVSSVDELMAAGDVLAGVIEGKRGKLSQWGQIRKGVFYRVSLSIISPNHC